jgi:hypothetical protein
MVTNDYLHISTTKTFTLDMSSLKYATPII